MFKTLRQRLAALAFAIPIVSALTASSLPRPEYPRPQFERADWTNLNGEWTYTFDFGNSGWEKGNPASKGFDDKIIVPFAPETKLSGVEHTDFINNIWYHRSFTVPAEWAGKRVRLNFGAVYYTSEVYVDGAFVGRHFGGSSSFSYDITDYLSDSAEHHLVVKASSDVRSGMQPAGKQSLKLYSMDCNYTRMTGIWQTVWLEPVSEKGLMHAQVTTDIDQQQILVRPRFHHESSATLTLTLSAAGKTVATKTIPATNSSIAVIPVRNMHLWTLEDPFLYDLKYQVKTADGKVIDEVTSYVGMRKIHSDGNRIYLNNKPCYQRLVLDQGFYPDGLWTAPSDEDLRHDIEMSKKAGFNGARLHQKVFEERFHYWADHIGYLTWGEAPSWGMDTNSIEAVRGFLCEWRETVIRDRNHPSIVTWTPLNEEFWPDKVQYPRFLRDLYEFTKELDPTRLVNICSGGVYTNDTDIWSTHDYTQNPEELKNVIYHDGKLLVYEPRTSNDQIRNIGFNEVANTNTWSFPEYDSSKPYVFDEFGGIKWVRNQEEQMKDAKNESWGYGQAPRTIEEFYTRLEGQVDALLSLSEHVWGYCYTQLTDVQQEQNGIYYYDRTEKFDMDRIHAIFSKEPTIK